MNLWVVRKYLVDYVYIYAYLLLSLSKVISNMHMGQNITFGLNDSTCNNPATVTWLYNNEFIANWSKPNVTYPKTDHVTNFSKDAVPSFAALPCTQASVILLLISIFLNI
ncbi:glycoprotein vIgFam2.5 [Elephant endotheliotropic herpesvirus 1A]|uniref:Glycoprotein vIgFam2.5 n=1 Tax=Elephant endotheliotropic herpesvirus 1A TaxID=759753 RepID=M1RMG5_ELHV1|nr:glycoprotein vIgFam2.5 [Elephant endotheliotropic herpesvirus 1A]